MATGCRISHYLSAKKTHRQTDHFAVSGDARRTLAEALRVLATLRALKDHSRRRRSAAIAAAIAAPAATGSAASGKPAGTGAGVWLASTLLNVTAVGVWQL